MLNENYYEIPDVKREVSLEKITRSYRKLALVYHPDKNNGSNEQMQLLNKAYKTLKDPKKENNMM